MLRGKEKNIPQTRKRQAEKNRETAISPHAPKEMDVAAKILSQNYRQMEDMAGCLHPSS